MPPRSTCFRNGPYKPAERSRAPDTSWSRSNDAKHRREGLSLPPDTLTDLAKIAQEMGIARL